MKDSRYRRLLEIPVPRNVRFRAAAGSLRLLIWTLGGIAIFATVAISLVSSQNLKALNARGVVTAARIYDKHRDIKPTRHYLDFEFFAQGRRFAGSEPTPSFRYDGAKIGDTLTVTYLPENPWIHETGRIDSEKLMNHWAKIVLASVIVLGLFGGSWAVAEHTIREDVDLVKNGTAVDAEVLRVRPTASDGDLTYLTLVKYPVGDRILTSFVNLSESEGANVEIGDRLILLISPTNPRSAHIPAKIRYAECPDILRA